MITFTYGNAYLEGVVYDGGINFYHKDASTARLVRTSNQFVFILIGTNYKKHPEKKASNSCIS